MKNLCLIFLGLRTLKITQLDLNCVKKGIGRACLDVIRRGATSVTLLNRGIRVRVALLVGPTIC